MIIVIIVFFVSVSGLGFGILSGAFSTVNVLADMVGPGTIGIYGDSKYFFVATGNCSEQNFTFVWYGPNALYLFHMHFNTCYINA